MVGPSHQIFLGRNKEELSPSGFAKDPNTEFTSQAHRTHVYTVSTRTFSSLIMASPATLSQIFPSSFYLIQQQARHSPCIPEHDHEQVHRGRDKNKYRHGKSWATWPHGITFLPLSSQIWVWPCFKVLSYGCATYSWRVKMGTR